MEERNVYQDISRRTDGDVYIGVVGPVRTGKSTFIKRFMDSLVLPNIRDEAVYRRTVDELPQSAAGRTKQCNRLQRRGRTENGKNPVVKRGDSF